MELKRIIAIHPYTSQTGIYEPSYGPKPDWFTPEKLGAGSSTLIYSPDSNHEYTLYFSKDSTHAYYCDMLD
jgi:hypothetical protein